MKSVGASGIGNGLQRSCVGVASTSSNGAVRNSPLSIRANGLCVTDALDLRRRLGRLEQVDDEPKIHLGTHRRLAEDRAHVQHSETAHLKKILEHGWAAPLELRGADAQDLDDVIGNEPVAAADQLEPQLTLADAGFASDQHTEAQHVHEHAVALGRLRESLRKVAAQLVDQKRRGQRAREHRDVARFRDLEDARMARHAVGHDERGRRGRKAAFDHAAEPLGLQRREMGFLVGTDDLDPVRMDQIEMADERGRLTRVLANERAAAGLAAHPGERQALPVVFIQLRDGCLQHVVAMR